MNRSSVKVCASVAILLAGLVLTIVAVSLLPSTDTSSSSGIIIDFGDYETTFTEVSGNNNPYDSLKEACELNDYTLVSEGVEVISIDGVTSGDVAQWSLYVVEKGQTKWIQKDWDTSNPISNYSAVCYGYCDSGKSPAPAVDATGETFYGYDVPNRIVSLAPSTTETVCFTGGFDYLVGTDEYSDYPEEVVEGQKDGSITIVGSFTSPSFEVVLKQNPDLVVCISTQNAHMQMASKLRAAGVDVLVLDGGESIDAVLDNIHAMGVVLNNHEETTDSIHELQDNMAEVEDIILSYGQKQEKRVMVALSASKSPWVSGNDTYVSDVMSLIYTDNIYSKESGWVQVNSETVSKYNPEVIIIVSTDYGATQSDYDSMIESLSVEWRGTDAYKSGEIYLFVGDAADCASRSAPRVAELAELLGRVIHGDAFNDGIVLPKFIGNDYVDYLTISRSDTE